MRNTVILPQLIALAVFGGGALKLSAADAAVPIPFATVHIIEAGDSEAVIAEKAAKVLPRKNQTDWFRMEQTFFIHFGPNTFSHVEWGNGRENPADFNPSALDAEQWVLAVKAAGGKMIIPTLKHHDGFCLWPTRYTGHSVVASPWRGGKGDLAKEVSDAAKKHGLKLGIYLSPADLYQLPNRANNPSPLYGNKSPKLKSVIPTDPATFRTDPAKGRTPPPGKPTFTYEVDDYNRYFLNQLYELLTEYGPIHQVWFDGAHPDQSYPQAYDYAAWYEVIRKLAPEAIIFGKGPDGRWVGNESGNGRTTEWSVVPLPESPDTFQWPDLTGKDLGSRAKLVPGSHLWWYPAEINVPILQGWFWAPRKACRTAAELIEIYYRSVGRNGIWLLNLSPDDRGLVPDDQLAHLRLSTQVIKDTFDQNLASPGTLSADSSAPEHAPAHVLDGNLDTWWEAAPGKTTAELTITLPSPATFDVVSLQEAIDHRGQRVESFDLDAWDGSKWTTLDTREERTTVGYKRLVRLKSPATASQVRLRVKAARAEPAFAEIGLYKQAEVVQPPAISERDANGAVTLTAPKGLAIVYTTDGTMPTPRSTVYRGPVSLPQGGGVSAAALAPDGRVGMMASKWFPGLIPTGWKIVAADGSLESAAKAIDGDQGTLWQAEGATPAAPVSLTIDLGRSLRIAGFSYVPRLDGKREGLVNTYRFETSDDGRTWTARIQDGRFDNIRNNPVALEIPFAPVNARFVRFTRLSGFRDDKLTTAAEISVITAR